VLLRRLALLRGLLLSGFGVLLPGLALLLLVCESEGHLPRRLLLPGRALLPWPLLHRGQGEILLHCGQEVLLHGLMKAR
jgi:hypothetical protein